MNIFAFAHLADPKNMGVTSAKYDGSDGAFWMVVIGARFYQIPRPMPRRKAISLAVNIEVSRGRDKLAAEEAYRDAGGYVTPWGRA